MSAKDTVLLKDGHISVTRVIYVYFPDNSEIIEILKSQISAIWSNVQLCRNIYEDDFYFSILKMLRVYYKEYKLDKPTRTLLPSVKRQK